jgi:hypothetical protein
MKLGAEPKKMAVLGVLLAVAAVSAYINLMPSAPGPGGGRPTGSAASRPSSTPPSTAPAARTETTSNAPRGGAVRRASGAGGGGRSGEFRPVFKAERSDSQLDPTKVDPALNLDLLAKLKEVRLRGTGRNLFQFGEAPPPPRASEPKIIPKPMGPDGRPLDDVRPVTPTAPVKPPPPPIPLRYYGFADPRQDARKRAFFMEGEDIRIASEGELIRERFRVVEISPRTAVVEDTQHDNRQTLTIQAESGG